MEPAACTGQKAPIIIGSVSSKSGVVGEAIKGGTEAVQAWVAAINAKGGINCHPVKFRVADDGADPNRHQALVQQMVETDKVIAFVQNMAPLSGFASVDYINRAKVPVIGNEGGSPWFHESPYFFPAGLSGGPKWSEAFFASPRLSGQAKGAKKVAAISCVEAPACSALRNNADVAAKKFGYEVVYNAGASLTQPDYTSHCLSAQSAGAKIFAVSLDGNSVHRVARSCAAVGYFPVYSGVATILNVDFADNPDMGHYVGATWTRTWFDTSNPEIQQYHGAMKRYVSGVAPSVGGSLGWSASKVFEYAARNVGDTPTAAQILDGLWSIKDNDFGGLTAPLTFTREQPTPAVLCFWSPVVRDGKWTGGEKRYCP